MNFAVELPLIMKAILIKFKAMKIQVMILA